jgi:hypothetical protein
MHAARGSEFSQEGVVARVLHGGVSGIDPPLAPPLIFIEHTHVLPHCRLISTLIRLGSNPYGP